MKFSRYIRVANIACTKREGYRVEILILTHDRAHMPVFSRRKGPVVLMSRLLPRSKSFILANVLPGGILRFTAPLRPRHNSSFTLHFLFWLLQPFHTRTLFLYRITKECLNKIRQPPAFPGRNAPRITVTCWQVSSAVLVLTSSCSGW